jgi:hypothetical protein
MKAAALLVLCLPAMGQTVCAPTPAYSPCDLVFELPEPQSATHPNPYLTAVIEAEFRSPHYRTIAMPGFWDGGRRLVVRFAPTEPGQWAFRVTSNIAAFDGKEGSVSATPSDSWGFIAPRNVHHWSYTEGNRPHLWMGDTCYPFAFLDPAVFDRMVDARAAQKFNHLRGVVLGVNDEQRRAAFRGTGAEALPNPQFFQELDRRIRKMNGKGMIADLILGAGGDQLVKQFPERDQRERLVRYLVARYAPMNVTWQGLEEFETYQDGRALLKELGQLLAKLDPYKHPRSTGTLDTSSPLAGDGWMNYVACQSSDDQLGAIEHQIYGVPFVNAGFGYEDSGAGHEDANSLDADAFRHRLWNAAMDGQYVTFGNTGTAGGKFPVDPKYLDSPGARQMGIWFDFFAHTRHWELEPYFDVDGGRAVALPGAGEEEEAVEYIVYVEKPQKVEVLVEKRKWDVAWLNPATGETVKEKDFKGDRYSGMPPEGAHDWVLHISREGKKESMLRSYKFESRPVVMQEVELNPQKLPFEITEPSADSLSISNPAKYAVKLTRESRATRRMMYLWTGGVSADGHGFRAIGSGAEGTFRFPPDIAVNFPAVLILRVAALNANGKVYITDKPYRLTR